MNRFAAGLKRWVWRHEVVLVVVIALEVLLFAMFGRRFLDGGNLANLLRFSVEIGLLALAMTPVILTGGIDLSVGSMMGLCAVVFGILVGEMGMAAYAAAGLAILVGVVGGALNAVLIARMELPPLIVTLGTFSLFRGLAEALTKGSKSYSGFEDSFLALGNGSVAGVPSQVWVFGVVAVAMWFWVHRTTVGRSFRAIGYSVEGSRYAGLPVRRNLGLAYLVAGGVAGLAAVIFVARLGEARANAGMGYELLAITAVVLGGTSIFGGSGSVHGTLLGFLAVAVLGNGLKRVTAYRIFDQPIAGISAELTGMLTGLLLLTALAAAPVAKRLLDYRRRSRMPSS